MIRVKEFHKNGVKLVISSPLTFQELIDVNNEIYGHEHFQSFRYELVIFENIKEVNFTPEEIRELAVNDKNASLINPNIKMAIVADSSLVFGMGRMFESYYGEGPWQIGVFQSVEEAEEWLGLKK